MYRVGLETILGFTRRGDTLRIDPRVPAHWPEFGIDYRYRSASYAITVIEPGMLHAHPVEVSVDGVTLGGTTITLVDDGRRHEVEIRAKPVTDRIADRDQEARRS
jgi:cyclic beta-1,2-glucan synthetase